MSAAGESTFWQSSAVGGNLGNFSNLFKVLRDQKMKADQVEPEAKSSARHCSLPFIIMALSPC
jgi:hypothetical protein